MAFSAVTALGTNGSDTGGGNPVITLGTAAEAGRLVVVLIAKDNVATTDTTTIVSNEITGITDSAGGNNWKSAHRFANGQGAANAGAYVDVWFSVLTNQINSGGTITVAKSTDVDCAVVAYKVTKGAGTIVTIDGLNQLAADAAAPGSLATSGLTSREHLHIRAIAAESETATGPTATGTWTAITGVISSSAGATAANMRVAGEFKISTSTGETSNPTLFSADHASVLVAFAEVTQEEEVLLLHGNGTDGSTTITDSSANAHSLTVSGFTQIDTAQSKFGGASILTATTGNAGHLPIPVNSDFTFCGDFTVDLWFRHDSSGAGSLEYIWTNGNDDLYLAITATNELRLYSHGVEIIVGTATPSADTWHHVAVTRSGSTTRLFLDGTSEGSATDNVAHVQGSDARFGAHTSGANVWRGWLDEIRILNGTAAWTANFTPGTGEYGAPVQHDRTTLFTGAGSFATVASHTVPRTTAFTAAGSLATVASHIIPRSTLFAAAGSVTTAAAKVKSRSTLFEAAGTLATTASHTIPRSTLFAATGTMVTAGTVSGTFNRSTLFEGVGSFVTTATYIPAAVSVPVVGGGFGAYGELAYGESHVQVAGVISVSTAFTAVGSFATAASHVINRSMAVTAVGSMASTAARFKFRTTLFAAVGSLATTAARFKFRSTLFAAVGSMASTAARFKFRSTLFAAVGSLVTARTHTIPRSTLFAATGNMASIGEVSGTFNRDTTFTAVGSFATVASHIIHRSTLFAATATVTTARTRIIHRTTLAAAVGSMVTVATRRKFRTTLFAAVGSLATTRTHTIPRSTLFAAVGDMATVGSVSGTFARSTLFAAVGSFVTAASHIIHRATLFAATATVTTARSHVIHRSTTFAATGSLVTDASKTIHRSALFEATGSFATNYSIGGQFSRTTEFTGVGSFATQATHVIHRATAFAGVGSFATDAAATFVRTSAFAGVGTFSTVYVPFAARRFPTAGGARRALYTRQRPIEPIRRRPVELRRRENVS